MSRRRNRAWLRSAAALSLIAASPATPTREVQEGPSPDAQVAYDRTLAAAKAAMFSDPVKARTLGRDAYLRALQWPLGSKHDVAVATAQWIEGEGAYRAGDIAAAGPLINTALAAITRVAPGTKINGDLLLSRAQLRRESGQPQTALADFQLAYRIFAALHDKRSEARALQSIGSIYQDAQDYNRVLDYYRQAEELSDHDPALSLSANNNMASAYAHLGRGREATQAYSTSLQLAKRLDSPLLVARILANVGDVAIESHQYDAADRAISAGLKLTAKPAAASWRPMLLGTRAKLELARGNPAAALSDVEAAFALSSNRADDQSFSALHLTAYRVYKATGEDRHALDHLETFRRIDDEGRTLAASTNAALMSARFDFANQNSRIATLKTGQLSRDVALTRLRARQSTVIFSSLLSLLAIVLVFLFVYLRSVRRTRNEVLQVNERLGQSNAKLEGALKAKSEFLATTSHEIRTPLNGILGMTQVILADGAVDPVVRDRVTLVDAAGRAMRILVDDILDFAKMDSGAVRLDTDPVDLMAMMPDLVALWQGQAQEKGIGLRLSMAGVERPLVTDAARLRQVVSNLLSNAIKFTASGEVSIDVVGGDHGQPAVTVTVVDTGIGIPPAAFETIFEPFHQLDTTTTRQFGGTGLGLAISRHLARVLGGDITVASVPGAGSTFTLRLPYRTAAAAEPTAVERPSAQVMIASVNPIRRSFLRTALEPAFGHTAVCQPHEAATILLNEAIGVVLADVADDDDLSHFIELAAVSARFKAPLRLVLLVPAGLTKQMAPAADTAVVRVVVKPVRAEVLVAVLREHMRGDASSTTNMAFPADLP